MSHDADRRPKMLLAFSDQRVTQALGDRFEEVGWKVDGAQSGKEALQYFEEHNPLAVIAPMILSDMPGSKLLREIHYKTKDAILILLAQTTGSSLDLRNDARANAVVDPSGGVPAILRVLERFSDRTGIAPAAEEKTHRKPQALAKSTGLAAELPDREALLVGSTAKTDPARVVGGVLRMTLTGRLTFQTDKKLRREIFVERGRPVFAHSSEITERFGEHLVREGVLTAQQLMTALHAHGRGQRLGETMVRMGLLDEATVVELLRNHIRERLAACFEDRDGTYGFSQEPVNPPTRIDQLPEPLELLRLGVHNHYGKSELDKLMPGKTVLRPALPLEGLARLARLNKIGMQLMGSLDGRSNVETLAAGFPSPDAAHQLLYALYAGGGLMEVM